VGRGGAAGVCLVAAIGWRSGERRQLRTIAGTREARRFAESSGEADLGFTAGQTSLVRTYLALHRAGEEPAGELRERASRAAGRSIELGPTSESARTEHLLVIADMLRDLPGAGEKCRDHNVGAAGENPAARALCSEAVRRQRERVGSLHRLMLLEFRAGDYAVRREQSRTEPGPLFLLGARGSDERAAGGRVGAVARPGGAGHEV